MFAHVQNIIRVLHGTHPFTPPSTYKYTANDEIVVPEDPLPCKEAQEYCKVTYGTNLATIRTDDARTAAQDALNTAGEAFGFIGLYSDDVETKWQFRSGSECPSASAYKCVDFWRTAPGGGSNRPRCIGDGEGGYGCAVIYADDGTVDNDKPDILAFPFLCDGTGAVSGA